MGAQFEICAKCSAHFEGEMLCYGAGSRRTVVLRFPVYRPKFAAPDVGMFSRPRTFGTSASCPHRHSVWFFSQA